MKKTLTFLLVRAVLDENGVPYLVADPRMPSRRVGIRRAAEPPASLDHYAEHFEAHAHVVDATDIRHLAHYREAEKAKTLEILGQCQASDAAEAAQKLTPKTTAALAAATE